MAFGIMQSDGSNISGFSAPVQPDKGLTRQTGMKVLKSQFGDGYELRLADGINTKEQTLSVSFTTRPKAEIDDLVKFFEDLGGVTKFRFDLEDSNEGSSEESIFCICDTWNQTWAFDNFYSLTASFQRCYEA